MPRRNLPSPFLPPFPIHFLRNTERKLHPSLPVRFPPFDPLEQGAEDGCHVAPEELVAAPEEIAPDAHLQGRVWGGRGVVVVVVRGCGGVVVVVDDVAGGVVEVSVRGGEVPVSGRFGSAVGAFEAGAEGCVGDGAMGVEGDCDFEFAGGDGVDEFWFFGAGYVVGDHGFGWRFFRSLVLGGIVVLRMRVGCLRYRHAECS